MKSKTSSPSPKVVLTPWDPDSPAHVERLVQQRISCGWDQNAVPEWQVQQREGKKNIHWVVIHDSDENRENLMAKHTTTYPEENTALVDSAVSLGGTARQQNSSLQFIPVGHISLDADYGKPEYNDPSREVYFIATFYISGVLQGSGVGGVAMDILESLALSEPFCAKRLALSTPDKDDPTRVERFAALKKSLPKVTNQEWYGKRGFEIYMKVEQMSSENDDMGKTWWVPHVFMKKDISFG